MLANRLNNVRIPLIHICPTHPAQKTGYGRITFLQFKTFIVNLKSWQGVFKMYTKEKSGILRAERLRDALYDVGFQLGSDVMAIIMLRYMRKDGTVRMGDFASAILHLTTAFEVFQKKDHDQDNVVKIEMVDVSWMGFANWLAG